jgi:O-antigen ligase
MGVRQKSVVNKNQTFNVYWVILGSVTITLYFNTKIQDPFNSPKMWLLLILAAACSGPVLTSYKLHKINSLTKKIIIVVIFFILSLLVSAILTNNSYVAFFGETQRRIGFLTYLAFVIIMLFIILRINFNNVQKVLHIMGLLGFLLAIYGLIQSQGGDFVTWNNPYNSVITTLGNPNYAAALLAILGVVSLGIAVLSNEAKIIKVFYFFNSLLILYVIILSNARQGLISFCLGMAIILIYYTYTKNKFLGLLVIFAACSIGVFSILGMLQRGPFADLLYKNSVSIRGYYWRAGIEMFQSKTFFGVGIDSYGDYFKEFRSPQYPLNYGFDLTSTNAHNVPIQLLATGGIFVGVSYLLLLILILFSASKLIKSNFGAKRSSAVITFSAWLSFQSQSIVSIDNIGLSIWGWILGGTLIGLYQNSEASNIKTEKNLVSSRKSASSIDLVRSLISLSFLVISIIMISNLYKGEKNAFLIRSNFQSDSNSQSEIFYQEVTKTFTLTLNDPYHKIQSAYYMIASGLKEEGLVKLRQLNIENPRNLDVLNLLAAYSEEFGLTDDAIMYRNKISGLDPWNAKNYLRLGNLYKFTGDKIRMIEIKEKILKFASNSPEGKLALVELQG